MGIAQSTSVRLPIKLLTSLGADPTGILPADVLNGIAQIVKSDGTKTSITLINNTNWFEVDSTQSKGLYHLLVPSGATNILGPIQYTLYPTATAFITFIGTSEVVVDSTSNISAIKAKTDNLPASPANETTSTSIKAKTDLIGTSTVASQTDITTARDNIKGASNIDLTNIAGTGFTSNTESLHALAALINAISITGIADQVWDEIRSGHQTNGSFGEAVRVLYQAIKGRVKVNVLTNKLEVFQEDGTTVLFSNDLVDQNNLAASIYATERKA